MAEAATQAVLSHGTFLEIEGPSSTWTEISDVESISIEGGERPDVEATHLRSPSETREYIAGLKDPPTLTLTGNYSASASQKKLRDAYDSGTAASFKLTFPTATPEVWTFSGIVKNVVPRPGSSGDPLKFECKIRIAGAITKTP